MIFQRRATLQGPPAEIGAWALEITRAVNDCTPMHVSLWQGLFGGPVGTFVWSTRVDSLTALEQANETLSHDATFLGLIDRVGAWATTPGEDSLLRTVSTAGGEYVRPDVGAYAEVTMAVPAEGKLAEATQFGVAMAEQHVALTHCSVLFCTSAYGAFGELRWTAMYDSAAAVDYAAQAISKDADYTQSIDRAGTLFAPGMTRTMLARRIA